MAKAPVRYEFNPAKALRNFQNGPDIPRPNIIAQQIPVVGSAWQAVGDLQDGNYGSAALNGVSAVAEVLPIGAVARSARLLGAGAEHLLDVAPSGKVILKEIRNSNVYRKGLDELHHAIPLNGASRSARDIRNHPAFLKILPKETHRRITGSYKPRNAPESERLPRFNPVERVWHGSTETMKAAPVGLLGYTVSTAENKTRASPGSASGRPQPAAPRSQPR